jgi:gliding motility-associated-like protein
VADNDIVPNGITPNGDGLNDILIFSELANTPELYPEAELLIFNRWGDIVYQAKPYANDWNGNNADGQPLPQGTYYYVLRLSIVKSAYKRGDVTILR